MTITTYSGLQAHIADTLNRDDMTSAIQTFIQLAEADMNRQLRHWQMEDRVAGTLDTRYSAIPTGWLETVRFNIITSNGTQRLELMSQADIANRRYADNDVAGTPVGYALTAGELEVYPTPDDSYPMEMTFYKSITSLSDSNTSNWVLEYFPDAYLYGALVHSAPYLVEDQRLPLWASMKNEAFAAIIADNERARWSGSGLRINTRMFS